MIFAVSSNVLKFGKNYATVDFFCDENFRKVKSSKFYKKLNFNVFNENNVKLIETILILL